jgi:hypothetical protein
MDGIAAEIAQEIGVLFQYQDINPTTREQVTEHHPRRTSSDDGAARGNGLRH